MRPTLVEQKNAPTGASQGLTSVWCHWIAEISIVKTCTSHICGGLQLIRFIVVGTNQDTLQQTDCFFLGIEA